LGALLLFDVTNRDSFLSVQRYMSEIRQNAEPDCVILLVANKIDLVNDDLSNRKVTNEEAKRFAQENKLYYIETSALSNYKVTEAFESLLECNYIKYYYYI
jgi:GTPase SAR1 family protein